MVLANRDEAQTGERNVVSQWTESLRTACVALVDTPSHVISAIRVTIPLGEPLTEARLLELLAQRLAEEYGLEVEVEVEDDQHSAMVRLSRRTH
jgi:hypothetical protein